MLQEITPTELQARLNRRENLQVVDVREESEFAFCNIGGDLIPLGDLPRQVDRIKTNQPVVVVCHHGFRSAQAIHFLQQRYGFRHLLNLKGGIHAWSLEVDPSVPVY